MLTFMHEKPKSFQQQFVCNCRVLYYPKNFYLGRNNISKAVPRERYVFLTSTFKISLNLFSWKEICAVQYYKKTFDDT